MSHRVIRSIAVLLAAAILSPVAVAASPHTRHVPISSHGGPLGFDDMGYAPALHRILVPAAQSGALALIDPRDQHVTEWRHVVPPGPAAGHHDAGTTSAVMGDGLMFVSDHSDQAVVALDPHTHRSVARAHLASGPDYVRYVAPLHQVWVTEPEASQIERFAVHGGAHPSLKRVGAISVPGGPEALVVDAAHGVAYTNQWKDHTLQISLHHPRVVASWPNTCEGSRGLALAPSHGLLFVGCKEGKVVALDPAHGGKVVAHAAVGAGVDIIAWNAHLSHLYAPGAKAATLSVVALGPGPTLHVAATVPAAPHAHCVATDGRDHAYVCDPPKGAVIVYTDRASD